MTATPIAMLDCGHEFAAAAFVIQWHSLGMFAPSFVTGHLITRLGLTRIMLTGAVLLLLCLPTEVRDANRARTARDLVLTAPLTDLTELARGQDE